MTKKKWIGIILFSITLVSVFCSLTACGATVNNRWNNAQKLQYKIAFADSYSADFSFISNSYEVDGTRKCNVCTIIDSIESLHEMDTQYGLSDEYDKRFFENFGIFIYSNNDLSKKMKEYDEDFFKDKMLLCVAITLGYYDKRTLKDVDLVDDEFVVTIEKPTYYEECDFEDTPTTHIFVIELAKEIGNHSILVNIVEEGK